MNKFKVGDKVRIVAHEVNRGWFIDYLEGVETVIESLNTESSNIMVNYYTSSGHFIPEVSMELVEQVKEIKTVQEGEGYAIEGDGIAIQAWAVEVDGEISPWQTYPSRKIAREERSYFESFGHKAHVRKVEIRKVKGKV